MHVDRETDILMLINLNAKSDFRIGDKGRVSGHTVMKVGSAERGVGIVVATQNVEMGMNGWFETQT